MCQEQEGKVNLTSVDLTRKCEVLKASLSEAVESRYSHWVEASMSRSVGKGGQDGKVGRTQDPISCHSMACVPQVGPSPQ